MKNIKYILFGLLALLSCNTIPDRYNNVPLSELPTEVRDGCEYFKEYSYKDKPLYIHKGDCKNPIHYFKTNGLYKYTIMLPDEYPLISTDTTHPDTLIAHVSRDTIYFSK